MAEKLSTALCNKLLDTAPMRTVFATPEIRFYTGTVPLTADAAVPAGFAIAARVKQAGGALVFNTTATDGVLTKSGMAWTDSTGTNPGGTATFYRMVNSTDDESDQTIAKSLLRIQGTVGTGAADMNLVSTTIAANTTFTINYYHQAIVPS